MGDLYVIVGSLGGIVAFARGWQVFCRFVLGW